MSYRSLFESNPLPIWVISRTDFRFLHTNPAATGLFGFSPVEFRSMTLADLHTPAEMESFRNAVAANEYPATLTSWRSRSKSGDTLDLELKIDAVETRSGPAWIVVPLDARERLGMELQMRQSQKMEAVGMLAGGIAHDFNNLLTIICGYTQMLLAEETLDTRDRAALEQILKAGDRAADLTRQLLNFSRRQSVQLKVLNLNSVVSSMTKMVRRLIGESIDLRMNLEADAGMIRVEGGKAEQVILNLVVNSRDAMPNGGRLTLATRREDVSDEKAISLRLRPGRYAVMSVNDTGTGMDAKTRDHVFEPFFTTKEQGTGLGLSTVYGIVKQAGGTIHLWSEKGVGTSMDVYLPRVEAVADVEAPLEGSVRANAGRETILIVEDEEAVRRLMSAALEQGGYQVLIAADGMEALKIVSSHEGRIDLLVTDLAMPGMNGTELARKVKERLHGTEVLFISGYAEELRQSGEIDDSRFLQKPFTPQALARKVREILDRHDRRVENNRSTVV
jgi:two-component system cell cycle sensor histidine kinase/response regulator CckA